MEDTDNYASDQAVEDGNNVEGPGNRSHDIGTDVVSSVAENKSATNVENSETEGNVSNNAVMSSMHNEKSVTAMHESGAGIECSAPEDVTKLRHSERKSIHDISAKN